MNNPLDKVPFDINSLIPYTEFNWDTVQGMDRINKDVSAMQGRITSGIAKSIGKVQNSVSNIHQKIGLTSGESIKSVSQKVGEIHQAITSQINGNVAQSVSKVSALCPPGYSLGTSTVGGSRCVKSTLPTGTPPVSSPPVTPVSPISPVIGPSGNCDPNYTGPDITDLGVQFLQQAMDASDNYVNGEGSFLNSAGVAIAGLTQEGQNWQTARCVDGCYWTQFRTPESVEAYSFQYDSGYQSLPASSFIFYNVNPSIQANTGCTINDLYAGDITSAKYPDVNNTPMGLAFLEPNWTAAAQYWWDNMCCPVNAKPIGGVPVDCGNGLLLPPGEICPVPNPPVNPVVPINPVPPPIGPFPPIDNPPCPPVNNPVPCPPPVVNCPDPVIKIVNILNPGGNNGPITVIGGKGGTGGTGGIGGTGGPGGPGGTGGTGGTGGSSTDSGGNDGSGVPIDFSGLCACISAAIAPLIAAIQQGNSVAQANGGGSDIQYVTTAVDDSAIQQFYDAQGVTDLYSTGFETLGDAQDWVMSNVASIIQSMHIGDS